MEKTDMFQHHLWELEERIEKYKDIADRNYLEIITQKNKVLAITDQVKELNSKLKTILKQFEPRYIELKKGGKLDHFQTVKLVRRHIDKYNIPGKTYHFQLIDDKNKALIINDQKLLDTLLKTVTKEEINNGATLRIKRSARNHYYVWNRKKILI